MLNLKQFFLSLFKKKSTDFEIFKSIKNSYDFIYINKITIDDFKKLSLKNSYYGSISTKYKNYFYPVYDLDSEESYQKFIKVIDKNYVIFRSSKNNIMKKQNDQNIINNDSQLENHYWAIVDQKTNIRNYSKNLLWNTINDEKYVLFCKQNKRFSLRFTYENIQRKPKLIKYDLIYSNDFKDFIDKFDYLLNNDFFEISQNQTTDKDLKLLYNRTQILKSLV